MIKKVVFVAVILIILFFVFALRNKTQPLVNPMLKPTVTTVPSASINQPKEIKYDSATNLEQELESVNPEVLDSDFSE